MVEGQRLLSRLVRAVAEKATGSVTVYGTNGPVQMSRGDVTVIHVPEGTVHVNVPIYGINGQVGNLSEGGWTVQEPPSVDNQRRVVGLDSMIPRPRR